MNILLKYPTRGRPQRFLETLRGWIQNAADLSQLQVMINCDVDDCTMTPDIVAQAMLIVQPITVRLAANQSKIAACNAGMNSVPRPWDIVLLVSDDMICRQAGWDIVIRESMRKHFPDTDGALWFYDGRQRRGNTLECVGRKRYERFGYIYHPSYYSFGCDDEATAVGLRDKKLVFIEPGICTHEHPSMGGSCGVDKTYLDNNKWFTLDAANFAARQAAGFPE